VIACFYHLEFARQLINGIEKLQIYKNLQTEIYDYLNSLSINPGEIKLFDSLLKSNIHQLTNTDILTSGYCSIHFGSTCLVLVDNG
jgi:ADP-ribosyl-[dinitrogen reductase] hydrolase